MKMLFIILIAAIVHTGSLCAQTEVLSNQSITDMIEIGLSEEVIVTKIRTTDTDFNTNIEALKVLKEKGVSNNVIMAMLNSGREKASNIAAEVIETENSRIGIYINQNNELSKLYPSVFSGSKTNTLGSALSYGLASSTINSVLNNPTSINTVESNIPEFIFFFARPNDQGYYNNGSNWWFYSATSPNEFILVKLERKGKTRIMKTGSVNIYSGANIGVDENSTIPFNIITVNDRTFKVTTVDPLEPGEYCFFYRGIIPQGGIYNLSVFDFSVSKGTEITSKYAIASSVWVLIDGKPKRCDVSDVKLKRDGIYYILLPVSGWNTIERKESECYLTKRDLINASN